MISEHIAESSVSHSETTYDQVILITGARDWDNEDTIREALSSWKDKGKVLLIHGACHGADNISGEIAQELGFEVHSKPADWKKYGRAAGPIRNREMVIEALSYQERGIPTIVLAFHNDLSTSKGTKNCVEVARKKGLTVEVLSE